MNFKGLKSKSQKMDEYMPDGTKREKYVNLGYETLGEINFQNIGFHFTPKVNIPSIKATGLKPKIGSNSKGGLGKEAIDKTFFSYGISGMMQLFNRLTSVSGELAIKHIRDAEDKASYLLPYQKDAKMVPDSAQMTMLEGFEYTRRYMEDCVYFGFDTIEPQYTKTIDETTIADDKMVVLII